MYCTAYRKGDLVKVKDQSFRLTSEAYELKPGRMYYDTDRENNKPISFWKLINKGHLIETISGRKNIKIT